MRSSFTARRLLFAALLAAPTIAAASPVPDAAPSTPVERAALAPPTWGYPGDAWPVREIREPVDGAGFAAATEAAFTPDAVEKAGTRALLVVHRGALVFERYAEGFGPASRHYSWSMAKSVTQAGIGFLVADGALAIDAPAPVGEWRSTPDDPRAAITVRHLLTMTSGLAWRDDGPIGRTDDSQMMFGKGRRDLAGFAAGKPLLDTPGKIFRYSSGNTNILGRIITDLASGGADSAGERREALRTFYTTRLFRPLGITSAVLETDAQGNFAGGSSVYMTGQDYARFGYLYLRGGQWSGTRVLPEEWAILARTRGPAENTAAYGGAFWLMSRLPADPLFPPVLPASPTAFAASGHDGQLILMVPDRELVIVRLGVGGSDVWPTVNRIAQEIAAAFPIEDGFAP